MQLNIKHKYVFIAIGLYLVASFMHVGYVHADEYYQIFQFAASKIGLKVLGAPWEYHDAMRSALLPSLVVVIYRFYALFTTPDPFIMGFIMRVISSIISLSSIIIMLQVFLPTVHNQRAKKYFSLLAFFTLVGMYFNVHYCSENIAGSIFLIAFSLVFAKFRSEVLQYILVGLFLALAFIARFQMGFLVVGILSWLIFIRRLNYKLLLILFSSILISIILFNIILDHWFYNYWTITAWNYFHQNIVLNKVNGYGISPWYHYLYIVALILPFGPLYIIACIVLFIYKPKHPLTWTLLPFFIIHSIIGHKEARFMAPVINLMPLCLMYALEIIESKLNINLLLWKKTAKVLWVFNCISLIVMTIPPTTELPVARFIYKNYTGPADYYFLTYGGSDIDFYKRQNLLSYKINNLNQIKCSDSKPCLLALTCGQAAQLNFPLQDREIYTQCPSFIFKLNFGDWINRTAIYKVYRLN